MTKSTLFGMTNNYLSGISGLHSYFIPVSDVNLMCPNVPVHEVKKERFMLVFFFMLVLQKMVTIFVKKTMITINFQVISLLQLLKSVAFEGGGGGGGHGGLAMRELLTLSTSPYGEPIYKIIAWQL